MYDFVAQVYFEKFDKIITKVNERLTNYLAVSNEENVHDVRTSIRRLDAAWKVLPKRIRQKRNIVKFVESRKEFFRINSEIRDFDIIKQKLAAHTLDDIQDVIKKIDKQKQTRLEFALRKAKIASQEKIARIDHSEVPQDKLEKRFKKITIRLINKIGNFIPIVVSSNKKIKQLHELRKDCKKLRYFLELTNHDESSGFINKLKEMQDTLGSIRDSDITIDFLKKQVKKNSSLKPIIKNELENREQMYKKFVAMQKF